MSRLIDADALRASMYHDAFETDTDLQKWDNGCWIRYKMFENHIEDAPTIDAEPVVRCKDCKHRYLDGMTWNCPFGLSGGEDFFCAYGSRMEVKQ